jgi:hypothetical protein
MSESARPTVAAPGAEHRLIDAAARRGGAGARDTWSIGIGCALDGNNFGSSRVLNPVNASCSALPRRGDGLNAAIGRIVGDAIG